MKNFPGRGNRKCEVVEMLKSKACLGKTRSSPWLEPSNKRGARKSGTKRGWASGRRLDLEGGIRHMKAFISQRVGTSQGIQEADCGDPTL